MIAVISDIHGNKEALEAVLRAISSQGVDEIWCLGDIVGYGPDPGDCIDLVERNCSLRLMGNHDWAVLNAPVGFNSIATRMIYRTKEWLRVNDQSADRDKARWDFLASMDVLSMQEHYLLVHASPRAELSEYILPGDVKYDPDKLHDIFGMIDRACIVGHTHVPCCISEELDLIVPDGSGFVVETGEKKMIINVGSVGQPRDGDNRACYLTLDGGLVRYHRVPYPFGRTVDKLGELGEEYQMLGYRLSIGR